MNTPIKTLLSLLSLCLCGSLFAAGNSHGVDSKVIVGYISEVISDNEIIVTQKSGGHRRHLKIEPNAKVSYKFFAGVGMKGTNKPAPGFVVKGIGSHKDGIDYVGNIMYSPELGDSVSIPNKQKLSVAEIFKITDVNQNGAIDYVEYSHHIARSEKHVAAGFPEADANGNSALEPQEFAKALTYVPWWKYSRKSAAMWIADHDKNGDGVLSPEEFKPFSGKSTHFNRTDKDKSGSISAPELAKYLKIDA